MHQDNPDALLKLVSGLLGVDYYELKQRDKEGKDHDVFLVKATYDLVDESWLKIAEEQRPISVARRAGSASRTPTARPVRRCRPFCSAP